MRLSYWSISLLLFVFVSPGAVSDSLAQDPPALSDFVICVQKSSRQVTVRESACKNNEFEVIVPPPDVDNNGNGTVGYSITLETQGQERKSVILAETDTIYVQLSCIAYEDLGFSEADISFAKFDDTTYHNLNYENISQLHSLSVGFIAGVTIAGNLNSGNITKFGPGIISHESGDMINVSISQSTVTVGDDFLDNTTCTFAGTVSVVDMP